MWVKRQRKALGRLLVQAAHATTQLVTLIQQSKSALSVPFPGLTPANVKHAQEYVRAHGLPRAFVDLARKYGLPASLVDAVKQKVKSGAGLPSYATSIYGILSYPPFISAEQKAANALQAYGQLLIALA